MRSLLSALAFATLIVSAVAGSRSPAQFALFLDLWSEGDVVVAVGERGLILRSLDLGRTWTEQPSGTFATLTCVGGSTSGDLWVGGHEGTLLRSTDGGVSWTREASELLGPEVALFGLRTERDQGLLLWGSFGLLARRTPAAEWTKLSSPSGDLHLYAGLEIGDETWLFGEAGAALRIPARGDAAELPALPDPVSLQAAAVSGADAVFVFGLQGRAFRHSLTDGTWQTIDLGSQQTAAAAVVQASKLLVAGQDGLWTVSDDGGRNWRGQTSPYAGAISRLLRLPDGAILIAGEKGLRRYEEGVRP